MDQKPTSVCRTCLTEDGEFQSIFVPDESTGSNIHLAEMIMSYAAVQVSLIKYLILCYILTICR